MNNCVGRDNYKLFVLFLFYTCVAAVYHTVAVAAWARKSDGSHMLEDPLGWMLVWINVFATG